MPFLVLALCFLAFVVLFTLAALHGTRIAGRMMGKRVNALHQAAESILETGDIPAAWLEPAPSDAQRRTRWAQRQQRRAVRRLRKVRVYMERTPSISDVESREYIATELDRIRERWAGSEPLRLVTPAACSQATGVEAASAPPG